MRKVITKERGWVKVEDEMPPMCINILFSDGDYVYMGWLEHYSFGEEPIFYNCADHYDGWPEGITHWMELPLAPNKNGKD